MGIPAWLAWLTWRAGAGANAGVGRLILHLQPGHVGRHGLTILTEKMLEAVVRHGLLGLVGLLRLWLLSLTLSLPLIRRAGRGGRLTHAEHPILPLPLSLTRHTTLTLLSLLSLTRHGPPTRLSLPVGIQHRLRLSLLSLLRHLPLSLPLSWPWPLSRRPAYSALLRLLRLLRHKHPQLLLRDLVPRRKALGPQGLLHSCELLVWRDCGIRAVTSR